MPLAWRIFVVNALVFALGAAALALDVVVGEPAPLELLADALLPTILLNLVLTLPVYALCRRVFRPFVTGDAPKEVRLLG